ncbi:GatB/YqeY domain-containing protein [Patescibacteria group bacterium]|nr:GatB/YqeY domain-containing protein [Patescibacteria group bacterium]
MSKLLDQINQEIKEAMKAKETAKLSTLRMLLSDVKNKKIELQKDLTDEDIQKVVKSVVKQRKDSIESYSSGGRDDLVKKEEAEIKVLEDYLPEEMDDASLEKIVDEVVAETGASSMKDMGQVMGKVMGKVSGEADGNRVKEVVQKKLS